MHWISITRRKKKKITMPSLEGSFSSRREAVDHLVKIYNLDLQPLVLKKLSSSGIARVPHQGLVEVVSCDCTDSKHVEELNNFLQ